MPIYGITSAGFVRKPLDVIELDLRAKATTLFGEDVDLSYESFEGLLIQLMAFALDQNAWQEAEDAYYSLFPDTSIGASLSRAATFGGVTRRGAVEAIVELAITGDPSADVPGGFRAGTNQSENFEIITAGVLDINGEGSFWFRAIAAGEQSNVDAGTINLIVTAVPGVDTVTNAAKASGGLEVETDPELLDRYKAQFVSAGSSIPGIIAGLNDNAHVETTSGIENYSDIVDTNGLPPKSFECIITGAYVPSEVARIIFNKKPAGIRPFGAISLDVTDAQGVSHTMYWSEATEVSIYIIVNLTTNAKWNDNYKTDVRSNIVKYIGGIDSQATDPVAYDGLVAGEDVFNWRVEAVNFGDPLGRYAPIIGVDAIQILIGRVDPPTSSDNIVMALREKAYVLSSDITVNVV